MYFIPDGDAWGKPIDFGDLLNKDFPWGAHIAPDVAHRLRHGAVRHLEISLDPRPKAHRIEVVDRK